MNEAARERRWTFEDVAEMDPDTEGGELDQGRFVPVTKNTWGHGEIVGNAYALLRAYAKQHEGWSVSVGDPGTKLQRDPDVLRGPDIGMVRRERRPEGKGAAGWLEGAPDLAVEVCGDAQAWSELMKKALEYLAAGGRMVWVLDPNARRVMVWTPPNAGKVLSAEDELDGAEVLPGFRCRVEELFE